jgi:hypothetical protein
MRYLQNNIRLENFHEIVIDYPDIAYENRESPGDHLFRTGRGERNVIIYERIN